MTILIYTPSECRNKAVSNGAVSFYLDSAVSSRVSRYTYGISVYRHYDSSDPDHLKRGRLVEMHGATGLPVLHGGFSAILPKVSRGSIRIVYSCMYQLTFTGYPG